MAIVAIKVVGVVLCASDLRDNNEANTVQLVIALHSYKAASNLRRCWHGVPYK